jgi:hypothetical protein
MNEPTIFGIQVRDIALGMIGILISLMSWIFNRQDKRISSLEKDKVDKAAHESRFQEVIRRLDQQDAAAILRDGKLDRLIERLFK